MNVLDCLVVLLVSSNLFLWKFIAKTPFKIIQFPWRLYLVPQVFLAYIIAWFLDQLIKNWKVSKRKKFTLVLLIVAVICGLQLSEQSTYISSIGHVRMPASTLMNTRDVTKDYYPKASLPEFKDILNHEAVAGKQRIKVTPKGHGEYKFKANRDLKRVQLPFVMYNGVKYRCEVNKKWVKCHSNKHKLLTIKNLKKGKIIVKIKHTSNSYMLWGTILVIIGIIIFMMLVIKMYNDSKKIKPFVKDYIYGIKKI